MGLSRNVKHLYAELARVYDPGDEIFVFGFSRGAFTVRTLVGFIATCGLVDPAPAPRTHRARISRDGEQGLERVSRLLSTTPEAGLRQAVEDQGRAFKRSTRTGTIRAFASSACGTPSTPSVCPSIWATCSTRPSTGSSFPTTRLSAERRSRVPRAGNRRSSGSRSIRCCGTRRQERTGESSRCGLRALTRTSAAAIRSRACRSSRSTGCWRRRERAGRRQNQKGLRLNVRRAEIVP